MPDLPFFPGHCISPLYPGCHGNFWAAKCDSADRNQPMGGPMFSVLCFQLYIYVADSVHSTCEYRLFHLHPSPMRENLGLGRFKKGHRNVNQKTLASIVIGNRSKMRI